MKTGQSRTNTRHGFTDYDDFGFGFIAGCYGNMDAPDFMPQGSALATICCNGKSGNSRPSQSHRDYPNHQLGHCHDE